MTLYEYLTEVLDYSGIDAEETCNKWIDEIPLSIKEREDINNYLNTTYSL